MQPHRIPQQPKNVGTTGVQGAQSHQEAARRLRERFQWLNRFSDQELQQITWCSPGSEMKDGDTYFDISNPERGTFTAQAGQRVPEGGCLVRKQDVTPPIWQKLTTFP